MTRWILAALTVSPLACDGRIALSRPASAPASAPGATEVGPQRVAARPPIEPDAARRYLGRLAAILAGRVLAPAELGAIAANGGDAVGPLLAAWVREEGFAGAARLLIQRQLSVSGARDGVDFELPGNLAAYLARRDLAWAMLLTADFCVGTDDRPRACDSGAPYASGVLATRAYLASRASRFNLTRASTMLGAFACVGYPMDLALQPRVERASLLSMFQAESPEEQTDPRAAGGFGNGTGCYTCHGQFAAHAQLFVKFDALGRFRPTATGLQDSAGELGRSTDGLYVSHFAEPSSAASERSQMFGRPVQNLAEAAAALAASERFVPCAARNLVSFALGAPGVLAVDGDVLGRIAAAAGQEPSLGRIAVAAFADRDVIDAVLAGTGGTP